MNVVSFPFVLYLIIIAEFWGSVSTSDRLNAECRSWQNIKNFFLQEKNEDINCVVNSDCTGLGCSGKYKEYDFRADIKLNACETPVTLDVNFNIPKLSVNNTKHTFHDGQRYQLPEEISPSEVYIAVSIKRQGQVVILGVVLEKHIPKTETWIPLSVSLIPNQTINVPPCQDGKAIPSKTNLTVSEKSVTVNAPVTETSTVSSSLSKNLCTDDSNCKPTETCSGGKCICKDGMNPNNSNTSKCVSAEQSTKTGRICNFTLLKTCLKNEICNQFNDSLGECECLDHFHLDNNRNCVGDDPSQEEHTSSVILTLAIAIPILILMVCGLLIFAVFKFRLFHHLRAYRRGVRTYEVVDIGNDEDDDEPLIT